MAACSVVAALAILPNASFLKPPMKFLSSPIKLQTSVDNPEPSEISSPIMRDSPWTIAVEYPREDPQVWSDAIAPEEVGVSLNLVKNIVGQGILTLPAGAALLGSSLGDHHQAMIQATLLCCVFGGLSGYAFYLVGAACARTGEPSYQAVWERAMGAGTFSWLPTAASIAMTSCGCVASLIAISSSAGDLLAGALGVPGSMVDHSLLLWALSLLVLLPLSIRDLGELTFASLAGVLGTCFTAAFIIERGLDGTYSTGGFFCFSCNLCRKFAVNAGHASNIATHCVPCGTLFKCLLCALQCTTVSARERRGYQCPHRLIPEHHGISACVLHGLCDLNSAVLGRDVGRLSDIWREHSSFRVGQLLDKRPVGFCCTGGCSFVSHDRVSSAVPAAA